MRRVLLCSLWLAIALPISVPVCSATDRPDFSGIWQVADPALIVALTLSDADPQKRQVADPNAPLRPVLMPAAKQRIDYFLANFDYRGVDDQGHQCVLNGMPWLMTAQIPYPIEILQTDKRMVMFFELHDRKRNIYFDISKQPAEVFPSSEGFSIGRWEGSTLVIETSALKASSEFSLRQRSDKAHIIERWNRVQDPKFGETIVIDMTIADPETFSPPFKARQVYKRAPANTWVGEYSCADALWEENIAKRKIEIERRKVSAPK